MRSATTNHLHPPFGLHVPGVTKASPASFALLSSPPSLQFHQVLGFIYTVTSPRRPTTPSKSPTPLLPHVCRYKPAPLIPPSTCPGRQDHSISKAPISAEQDPFMIQRCLDTRNHPKVRWKVQKGYRRHCQARSPRPLLSFNGPRPQRMFSYQ